MRHLLPTLLALFSYSSYGQAVWQQMTSAPGPGRFWAAATGNDTHGYAGTGLPVFAGNSLADMFEYNVATDTWAAIPAYPGGAREGMDGFTIGQRIFFAFGTPGILFTKTIYEYLPATQTWIPHPDVPGNGFAYSHGFVIGDNYYIGPENWTNNVYAFNGTSNSWSTVEPFPGNDRRQQCAFSANGKGYLGMGSGVSGGTYNDWWEYDPITDSWTEVASISPHSPQSSATAVNGVGYVYNTGGMGLEGKQLYRYNAATDDWSSDAILPTDRIANASAFTIGGHGYLVFGEKTLSGSNVSSNELWRFTPGSSGIMDQNMLADVRVLSGPSGSVQVVLRNEPTTLVHMDLIDLHARIIASRSSKIAGTYEFGSSLPVGIYLVRLQVDHVIETRRVVVN